jgi:hypothetical protein
MFIRRKFVEYDERTVLEVVIMIRRTYDTSNFHNLNRIMSKIVMETKLLTFFDRCRYMRDI